MPNDSQTDDDSVLLLHDKIIARLRTVFDPEIPVNLYDLGLIYRIDLQPIDNESTFDLTIDMTLTSAGCPMADLLPSMVHKVAADLPELNSVKVNLVWDPPWSPANMSDEARLILNMF